MLIINDEEFVEGIIGALGWIIAIFYIRNGLFKNTLIKSNMAIIGGFSWTIMWFIRKIGANLYKHIKKHYKIKDKNFKLPFNEIKHIILFILVICIALYFSVFQHTKKSNQHIFSISYHELPLILIILIFGIGVFNSKP